MDNLGGATVLGRVLRVDHARYKPGEGDAGAVEKMDVDGGRKSEGDGKDEQTRDRSESEGEREMLQEEIELTKLIRDHDEEDPMKEFLVQEKKEEVRLALERVKMGGAGKKERKHKHRHRHQEDGERHGRSRGHREERGVRARDVKKEDDDDPKRNESPRSRRRPDDSGRQRSQQHKDFDGHSRDRDDAYHHGRER